MRGINRLAVEDRALFQTSLVFREIITVLATREEQADEKFDAVKCENRVDFLSEKLRITFDSYDYEAIRDLNKYRLGQQKVQPVSPFKAAGLAFGAASLLLNFVPKSVIALVAIDYTVFQQWVFFITVASSFYIFLGALQEYSKFTKKKLELEFFDLILEYTVLNAKKKKQLTFKSSRRQKAPLHSAFCLG
jgi:hypothetical protein